MSCPPKIDLLSSKLYGVLRKLKDNLDEVQVFQTQQPTVYGLRTATDIKLRSKTATKS